MDPLPRPGGRRSEWTLRLWEVDHHRRSTVVGGPRHFGAVEGNGRVGNDYFPGIVELPNLGVRGDAGVDGSIQEGLMGEEDQFDRPGNVEVPPVFSMPTR